MLKTVNGLFHDSGLFHDKLFHDMSCRREIVHWRTISRQVVLLYNTTTKLLAEFHETKRVNLSCISIKRTDDFSTQQKRTCDHPIMTPHLVTSNELYQVTLVRCYKP